MHYDGEDIFRDDWERRSFLDTLSELCGKTPWQVPLYRLMRNHFDAVAERLAMETRGHLSQLPRSGAAKPREEMLPANPRGSRTDTVLKGDTTVRAVSHPGSQQRSTFQLSVLPWSLLIMLFLGLLFGRSMTRPLNHDEHQFVAPAVLVMREGLLPYRDYTYLQMPTLIYLYAAVLAWVPYKLLAARVISVLCGAGTLSLIFGAGWFWLAGLPREQRWRIVVALTLTLFTCRMFTYTNGLAWNQDASVLCGIAAVLIHLRGLSRHRMVYWAASGFLLGLAVGIRLTFALVSVPMALVLWFDSPQVMRKRLGALVVWGAAVIVALLPAVFPMLTEPRQFFFGNLEYRHLDSIRSSLKAYPFVAEWPAKCLHLAWWYVSDPGNLLLTVLFLGSLYFAWRNRSLKLPHRNRCWLLGGSIMAMGISATAPVPMMYQYGYALVPFVVLMIFAVIATWPAMMSTRRVRWLWVVALVLGAIGVPRWYWKVIYVAAPSHWTPVVQHRIGGEIRNKVGEGALVLTTAPIAVLEANLRIYPALATGPFTLRVASLVPPVQRAEQRILGLPEVKQLLAVRAPAAVYVDPLDEEPQLVELAREVGYRSDPAVRKESYQMFLKSSSPRTNPRRSSRRRCER